MPTVNPVFEKTYQDYLKQIAAIDPTSIEQILGVRVEGREITIPLFGIPHKVSEKWIADPSGRQPSLDICVILCRYILLCPGVEPKAQEWVSFRDFKDSGPLTVFFLNDVERAIANCLTGNLDNMKKAGKTLGGYRPGIDVTYDLAMQFDALPKVPLFLLFNDADEEFPAKSSVLFERRAESYLDPECLAMLGRLLFTSLKKAGLTKILDN